MSGSTTEELDQVLRHEAALRRLAAALCKNAHDADDAVQHVLTQAALGRRAPEIPVLGFLKASLRNHLANLRKLTRRRQRRENAVAVSQGESTAVDVLVARDELRRRVSQAVLVLPEPYRTTIWLRWFEDVSVDAIAGRMDVPRNTVRTRLQRGHAQLRAELDRDYGSRQWLAVALPWTTTLQLPEVGLAAPTSKLAIAVAVTCITVAALAWRLSSTPHAMPLPTNGIAGAEADTMADEATPALHPTMDRIAINPSQVVRFETHEGQPLANALVWFWQASNRPRWAQRARLGRAMPGVDSQRDTEPAKTSSLQTDANGSAAMPTEHSTAVSVQFAPHLWFSVELPIDQPIVLPELAEVTARVAEAPVDTHWECEFSANVSHDHWGSARWNAATPSGAGVVWIEEHTLRGTGSQSLTATMPKGMLTMLDRINGHGFKVVDEQVEAQVAPCEFVVRAGQATPRLTIAVITASGSSAPVHGYAKELATGQVRWLEDGAAVFDGELPQSYTKVAVRLANGLSFESAIEWPDTAREHRIAFLWSAAKVPIRVELQEGHGQVMRGWLDWRQSNPLHNLGKFGNPNFGFADWAFGNDAQGAWLADMPADWRQLFLATSRGRIARLLPNAVDSPSATWLPAGDPTTIDVAQYFRTSNAPAEATATLEFELPFISPRRWQGQQIEASWQVIFSHHRDPEATVVTPEPTWRDVHLPTSLAWRLCIRNAANELIAEYRRRL